MNYSVRRDDRHRITADIRVATADGRELALSAIDLSRGGIGTDGLMQFDAEQPVRVTFPDGTTKTGWTMWHEDFSAGILFDEALSEDRLAALLHSLAQVPRFR